MARQMAVMTTTTRDMVDPVTMATMDMARRKMVMVGRQSRTARHRIDKSRWSERLRQSRKQGSRRFDECTTTWHTLRERRCYGC